MFFAEEDVLRPCSMAAAAGLPNHWHSCGCVADSSVTVSSSSIAYVCLCCSVSPSQIQTEGNNFLSNSLSLFPLPPLFFCVCPFFSLVLSCLSSQRARTWNVATSCTWSLPSHAVAPRCHIAFVAVRRLRTSWR
jgi:hypothetical protein